MNLNSIIDKPSSNIFCQIIQYEDYKEDKDPEKIILNNRASHTIIFY